ncbi:MAG: TMEM175 family protein [Acidobacteriota bacterium]
MLREKLMQHEPVDGFRWRSHEIARIEGFSDAVFGFAVTLLIVSLEVPRTSTELLHTMRGFGSFVVTFMILAGLWHAQYTFFRRYGLEDRFTVILNLILLFTVLFFVYPLKFLFSVILTDPRMAGAIQTAHGRELIVLPQHKPFIFLIFAAGFIAVFTVFVLLYRHAYKQREALGLNEFEIYETSHAIRRMQLSIVVGLMYVGLAGQSALPKQTPQQRQIYLAVAILVLLAFAGLMFFMFRMMRERKRVRREWDVQRAGQRTD